MIASILFGVLYLFFLLSIFGFCVVNDRKLESERQKWLAHWDEEVKP